MFKKLKLFYNVNKTEQNETKKLINVQKVCDEVRGKYDNVGLRTANLLLERIRLELTILIKVKVKATPQLTDAVEGIVFVGIALLILDHARDVLYHSLIA